MPSPLNLSVQPQLADWNFVEWLSEIVYNAMVVLLTTGINLIVSWTDPEFSSTSYLSQFELMKTVGLAIIIPMVMLAVMLAIIKGSLKELLQTFAIAVPAAILGAPLSLMFVRVLQAIDKNLTDFVLGIAQTDADGFLQQITDTNSVLGEDPGVGTLGALAAGAFVISISLLFLMFEFAFRSVMLSIGVVFLPLALGFAVWAPARRFLVVLVETVVVLVFAKFIAIATLFIGLALGFGALQAQGWEAVEGVIIAGLVIVFACCALPALLAFVFGQGPNSDPRASSREVINKSPFGLASGNQAARNMAVQGIKGALGKK